MKLLLATTSPGKLREQRVSLEGLDIEIVTLESWPELAAPDEPGPSFLDNAKVKALFYHDATGLPSLGEDSGLVVDALDGEPGVHSARWLGHDTPYDVKNARILEKLAGVPERARAARFVSTVALAEDGAIAFTAEGVCEGRIASEAHGKGGFGYDPIFHCAALERTMAELTAEEKNRVSHRGQAMAQVRRFLEAR